MGGMWKNLNLQIFGSDQIVVERLELSHAIFRANFM